MQLGSAPHSASRKRTRSLLPALTAQWSGARPVRWQRVPASPGSTATRARAACTNPGRYKGSCSRNKMLNFTSTEMVGRASTHWMPCLLRVLSPPVRLRPGCIGLRLTVIAGAAVRSVGYPLSGRSAAQVFSAIQLSGHHRLSLCFIGVYKYNTLCTHENIDNIVIWTIQMLTTIQMPIIIQRAN